MKAIILAGGEGRRLRPYTMVIPKPMLPIGQIPVIEIISRQLKYFGFDEVSVALGYRGSIIQTYLQSLSEGPELPHFTFQVEQAALGTSGALPFVISEDDDDVLVLNGDVITDLNLEEMFEEHCEHKVTMTLAVRHTSHTLPFGCITLDEDGCVKNFQEKPSIQVLDNLGIYVFSRNVLNFIRPGEKINMDQLVNRLIHEDVEVHAHQTSGNYYWVDIGTHADYEKANREMDSVISKFPFMARG